MKDVSLLASRKVVSGDRSTEPERSGAHDQSNSAEAIVIVDTSYEKKS